MRYLSTNIWSYLSILSVLYVYLSTPISTIILDLATKFKRKEGEGERERERRMKEADTLQLLLFAEVAAGPPTTCYASVSGGGGRSPNIYPRQYNNSTISSFWSRAPKSKSLSLYYSESNTQTTNHYISMIYTYIHGYN